jgi:hypothetical protein
MDKPAIPQIPKGNGNEKFYKSIKECLETIMGRRSKPIKPLNSDASSDDVIAKINEIIERLQ